MSQDKLFWLCNESIGAMVSLFVKQPGSVSQAKSFFVTQRVYLSRDKSIVVRQVICHTTRLFVM